MDEKAAQQVRDLVTKGATDPAAKDARLAAYRRRRHAAH
jgi:hypothetical protein